MKHKFKDRYVLGVGYPEEQGFYIGIWRNSQGGEDETPKQLKFPACLREAIVPKYRLILERVK